MRFSQSFHIVIFMFACISITITMDNTLRTDAFAFTIKAKIQYLFVMMLSAGLLWRYSLKNIIIDNFGFGYVIIAIAHGVPLIWSAPCPNIRFVICVFLSHFFYIWIPTRLTVILWLAANITIFILICPHWRLVIISWLNHTWLNERP